MKKTTTRKAATTVRRSSLIDATLMGTARTANGAPTNPTSMDACVDLFFLAGASRAMKEREIISIFSKAYGEDPLTAMKILFWARDVRGGAGERHIFQVVTKWLEANHSDVLYKNVKYIPEFGRWKDIFDFNSDVIIPLIKKGLKDEHASGLLAKWLPRKGDLANAVRKALRLTPKGYRKLVVGLSNTVEQKMCAKEYGAIKYEAVPSVAMNKYRKAFYKNDDARFKMFIDAVTKGEKKINAGALFPYDLLVALREGGNEKAIQAQWNALTNYLEGSTENFLVMADVSGSMGSFNYYGGKNNSTTKVRPIDISVSLAIYLSERSRGIFKDAFLTFTSTPTMQYLKGELADRVRQLKGPVGYDTNIQAAFTTILSRAKANRVPVADMPSKILIISDMEFNCSEIRKPNGTTMDMIIEEYKRAGYKCPEIIFWNVNGREENVPAKCDMKNVGLVSGFSPSIITSILSGKVVTPRDLMIKAVYSDRYEKITI